MKLKSFADFGLPIGVLMAETVSERIDALYDIADDPDTPKHKAEECLRQIARLNGRAA